MKIYTKTGDSGLSSLLSGQRVKKNHERIEAYGTIDELNSFIALLASYKLDNNIKKQLLSIQNSLFTAGSQLAVEGDIKFNVPKITEQDIADLEHAVDEMEAHIPKLKSFILPGGSPENATAHICRSICRRAERKAVGLQDSPKLVIQYLNRLSDYFFVLARYISALKQNPEVIWTANS